MHKKILTKEQIELLPLIKLFSDDFGLVGGTAIALHMGHRRSIDFDLFTYRDFDNLIIRRKIKKNNIRIDNVIVDKLDEFTSIVKGVKLTFFHFPYKISYPEKLGYMLKFSDLLTLAAMKAFSLGRRAKWKDYVDLYFIMKDCHDIHKIIKKTKRVFGSEFNEKLFRAQLCYFDDIDYTEQVDYLEGFEVADEVIKKKLTEFSLS